VFSSLGAQTKRKGRSKNEIQCVFYRNFSLLMYLIFPGKPSSNTQFFFSLSFLASTRFFSFILRLFLTLPFSLSHSTTTRNETKEKLLSDTASGIIVANSSCSKQASKSIQLMLRNYVALCFGEWDFGMEELNSLQLYMAMEAEE